MLNILCVCGNGMGTSTILKLNVTSILAEEGIKGFVESTAFGEAGAYLANTDLIVTSPEWSSMIPQSNAVIAETRNLVDKEGVRQTILEAIREHFPEELEG